MKKKRDPIIPSYISEIRAGSLVKWIGREWVGVGVVQHSSQYLTDVKPNVMEYHLIFDGQFYALRGEGQLRYLTFKEFLWYKDPITGGRKVGKNRLWPIAFGEVVAFLSAWAAMSHGGASLGVGFAAAFPIILNALILYGTWRNFKGKQF